MNVYTVKQAARELGISPAAVYRLMDRGRLGRIPKLNIILISKDAIEDLKASETYQRSTRRRTDAYGQERLDFGGKQ